MVAARRHNLALCFNRPIYSGFSILELSKVLMYSLHLKYIKKHGPRALLWFTDTESLCYEIINCQVTDNSWMTRSEWERYVMCFETIEKKWQVKINHDIIPNNHFSIYRLWSQLFLMTSTSFLTFLELIRRFQCLQQRPTSITVNAHIIA